ncbi:MAG: DegT/DnrJ/EryC1/StrS family aminotransferase, partial [Myxococcales bacterium]|nr:DegT/DnrJ/EryC1/StrS family aminotransferase [Myxococcales bacterium]
ALESAITPRTRAILPVHLFGQPAEMEAILAIAEARSLPILEDAAQALGASTARGPVGTLGALGAFSFFPSKNLGGFGDGGLVTTTDPELAERVRVLRAHGAKPKYHHARIGGNFRLDALQAAILAAKLPSLDGWAAQRRQNADRYDRRFAEAALEERLLTPLRRSEGHVYNQYVIRTDRRDALQAHLRAEGIATAIYYPVPLHLQGCYAELGYREGSFPEAERAAQQSLALPIFPELGDARLDRIAETVIDFLRA